MYNEIKEAHKFFINETPKYLLKKYDKYGNSRLKWKTRNTLRTSTTYWYYPLKIKEKLYYPIAYIKFMYYSINDQLK